jgi:cytochrome c oxidase assembly protein subunit 15
LNSSIDLKPTHQWPHRLAVILACATFPLIWVGGLVTTYDAGMAVPDWPSTYGYNLFLYPLSTWLAAPWDLFIEHGHRLLGAAVGMIAIAFLVVTWRYDSRPWMKWAAVGALLLVIVQGVLGGQRVVQNSRQIAQIHGIVGPLFFTLTVFLALATSRWWQRSSERLSLAGDYVVSAWMIAGLSFLQLVLGSNLRHVDSFMSAGAFSAFVAFHIAVALILLCMMVAVGVSAFRSFKGRPVMARSAMLLSLLALTQVGLGVGTWIVKYGWPSIVARFGVEANVVVQVESLAQAMVTTAHVACGALILAFSFAWVARVSRLAQAQPSHEITGSTSSAGELAAGGAV